MKMRNFRVSHRAGALAAVLLLSLFLNLIPTQVHAASSSEIRQQIKALKADKEEIEDQIKEVRGQYQANEDEITDLVNQKNTIDQEI